MKTCDGQLMNWWSDVCETETCGHLLAAHKEVEIPVDPIPQEPIVLEDGTVQEVPPLPSQPIHVVNGECTFCVMEKQNAEQLEAAKTELRNFASQLMEEAKEFAGNLQDAAKQYIDSENSKFAGIAKDYVDGQIVTTVKSYVDGEVVKVRNDSKSYIDSEIGKVPTWTNNRIAQVVKPTSLNFDPRTQ